MRQTVRSLVSDFVTFKRQRCNFYSLRVYKSQSPQSRAALRGDNSGHQRTGELVKIPRVNGARNHRKEGGASAYSFVRNQPVSSIRFNFSEHFLGVESSRELLHDAPEKLGSVTIHVYIYISLSACSSALMFDSDRTRIIRVSCLRRRKSET